MKKSKNRNSNAMDDKDRIHAKSLKYRYVDETSTLITLQIS